MISVGEKIDLDLRFEVVERGERKSRSLRDLLSRPTIISVYMKNNTPGCDRQNDALVSAFQEITQLGYNLIALSRDTCGSHLRYAEKKKIDYILASDPTDSFARATNSLVEKSMYGRTFTGPLRAAYVLSPDGTVEAVIPQVDTTWHDRQLLSMLKELRV